MMGVCKSCENSYCHYIKTDTGQTLACSGYVEAKKPMTNADRIRANGDRILAISDEELADYLLMSKCICKWCAEQNSCNRKPDSHEKCMYGVLAWLQQPVEAERMNQFVRFNGWHININRVELFGWTRGILEVHFAGEEPSYFNDPDKKSYYELCGALGVEPAEVE